MRLNDKFTGWIVLVLIGIALGFSIGCTSSDDSKPRKPAYDVTGTWSGTLIHDIHGSSEIGMIFSMSPDGSLYADGWVDGWYYEDAIRVGRVEGGKIWWKGHPNDYGEYPYSEGTIHSASYMSGWFEGRNPIIEDDSGTWELRRE